MPRTGTALVTTSLEQKLSSKLPLHPLSLPLLSSPLCALSPPPAPLLSPPALTTRPIPPPCQTADCLKDLQRFLRRDLPGTREVFHLLGQYNLVKTDLVPLIVTYPGDHDIVFNSRGLFSPRHCPSSCFLVPFCPCSLSFVPFLFFTTISTFNNFGDNFF